MDVAVQHFFHEPTSTLTYVVHDGQHAVVVDPVRDYDPKSGRTSWKSAEEIAAYADRHGLSIAYVLDTHVHADHLSGIPFFRERYGARSVTGRRVGEVQRIFRDVLHLGPEFPVDGRPFDFLLDEGEELKVGSFFVRAFHTPGHTPAHMSWAIPGGVFLGDTLFAPDYGTARCDFPGGSPEQLYESIQRIYRLPETTRLFLCHDYRPGGRPLRVETTVGEQKESNVHLNARTRKAEFVALRRARDAALEAPALLWPSIQVNIRAGALPPPEANGISYLKIPLDWA
jgi:glyoxylase-like metal-dependent hydrolase (beta-lactamase superfamily II)